MRVEERKADIHHTVLWRVSHQKTNGLLLTTLRLMRHTKQSAILGANGRSRRRRPFARTSQDA